MTAREQLIAYIATLVTLVAVFAVAIIAASLSDSVGSHVEVFGLGTVMGGLIGVLRIPSSRNPVATTDSGDVTVTPAPSPQPEAGEV